MRFDYGSVRSKRERECRDEALDVLRRLDAVRLPAARWDAVENRLEQLDAALRQGDIDAAERAVVKLELDTQPRVRGIGEPIDGPPPKRVRVLAVQLIHSLRVPTPDDGDGSGDRGDGDGDGLRSGQRPPGGGVEDAAAGAVDAAEGAGRGES